MMETQSRKQLPAALLALARVLEYPANDFESRVRQACAAWEDFQGEQIPAGAGFADRLLALSPAEREELFTSVFDVTPVCAPYVSIYLFGEENFKRGEFMAALKGRYQEAGFDAGCELPDHLAVLLRFAALTNETERSELLEFCILGPLRKMIGKLAEENAYRELLDTVQQLLQRAYPDLKRAPSPLEQMGPPAQGCSGIAARGRCGVTVKQPEELNTPKQL